MRKTYHALSLKQPWLNYIRDGKKTIETRKWSTTYRGELLLCASKKPAIEPYGCAVLLVDLVDVRPMTDADWPAAYIDPYPRAYGWHLANIRRVNPVPVKGMLNIFTVDLDLKLL